MTKYLPRKWNVIILFSLISVVISGVTYCDPDGKKDCDWVMEVEPNLASKLDSGLVPLCARNRKTMKQDCRFAATVEDARKYVSESGDDTKVFRYPDVKVKSPALPRMIESIKFCE